MRRSRTLVVAVALAAVMLPAANARTHAKLKGNNFYSNCFFSHVAADDPIVFPGKPGLSHSHTFFGNTSTNAFSTLSSLRRARTTCRALGDTAAYWVPTLYLNGREIRPTKAQFYYVVRSYDRMRAFPAGLRMIAGDSAAVQPQSQQATYWACAASAVKIRISSSAPRCGLLRARPYGLFKRCAKCPVERLPETLVKTRVALYVSFPDCWDGVHLDSPDHRSHMAYSHDFRCPASHPVKVPLIRMTIRYPLTDGRKVVLASGGQFSGHADFFNAWNQRQLTRLVDDCFHNRGCDSRVIHT